MTMDIVDIFRDVVSKAPGILRFYVLTATEGFRRWIIRH